jgi:hypothetical protein
VFSDCDVKCTTVDDEFQETDTGSEHIEHACTVADATGTAPQPDERAADGSGTPPEATGSARIASTVTAETIGTVPQPAKHAADDIGTPAEATGTGSRVGTGR